MKKSLFVEVAVIRVLVVLIQLVLLKFYTKNTSVYELGIYFFLSTVSYSLNAFLLVPLDYFQQSKLYKLKERQHSLKSFYKINVWVVKFTALLLLVSLGICFLIKPAYCYVIPFVVLFALSTYFVNLIRGFINNLERRRTAIYTILVETILRIIFYFIFFRIFQSSGIVILSAFLASSLSILVVLIFLMFRMPEYKSKELYIFETKEIVSFSYPISMGAVINWIQLQGYRMILVPLGLVDVVGIYATVANVGTAGMGAYSVMFSQIFVPNIYKTNGTYIKTFVRNGLLSILAIMIGGYIFSDFLVGLLTKQELIKYSSIIIFGIISEGGNFLLGPLIIYLTLHNLTKISIKANLVGLATFFITFFLLYLSKKVSVYTIGLPIIITQLVLTVYLIIVVAKIKKEKR